MDPYFSGKRVLVTGAGKGIGRQLCKTLTKLGANVIAISRTVATLESLKSEEPAIEIHAQDITEWSNTRKLIEEIGPVDMLVNNAANVIPKKIVDIEEKEYDAVFNTNVKAAFNVSQVVAKTMIEKQTGGAIVNVSSLAGVQATDLMSIYCCSKSALDMLTKTMALEFGPHQIRVNSVNPTAVNTDMFKIWVDSVSPEVSGALVKKIPAGRVAEIDDVVNAIVFLLSDKASMIYGIMMPVDGGHSVRFLRV